MKCYICERDSADITIATFTNGYRNYVIKAELAPRQYTLCRECYTKILENIKEYLHNIAKKYHERTGRVPLIYEDGELHLTKLVPDSKELLLEIWIYDILAGKEPTAEPTGRKLLSYSTVRNDVVVLLNKLHSLLEKAKLTENEAEILDIQAKLTTFEITWLQTKALTITALSIESLLKIFLFRLGLLYSAQMTIRRQDGTIVKLYLPFFYNILRSTKKNIESIIDSATEEIIHLDLFPTVKVEFDLTPQIREVTATGVAAYTLSGNSILLLVPYSDFIEEEKKKTETQKTKKEEEIEQKQEEIIQEIVSKHG